MDIETAANPADDGPITLVDAVEAASNQTAQQEANTPAEGSTDSIEDLTKEALGEAPGATPEDMTEVEYEGEKLKLPSKWRDAFLRQQDYTKKTTAVADERRALEARAAEVTKAETRTKEEIQAIGKLTALDMQIKQYEALDIRGWSQEEVNEAAQHLNGLKAQAGQIANALQQHEAQKAQASSENLAKLRETCLAEASARVPNFTDTRRQELEKLAVDMGADPKEVGTIVEPYAYELLHYADIGRKFIERQRKAAQMRTAQAGEPAAMLGSANGGGKRPEDMSMDEYNAWRAAGNG